MHRTLTLFLCSLLAAIPAAAEPSLPGILPLRQRAEVMDRWLELRLQQVVPELMEREGIDMWILIAREYNEDPVVRTMLPATWMSARRRTILVFAERGQERLAVARYDIGRFFPSAWEKEKEPDQWKRLVEIIREKDPGRIALNRSRTFALADGLTESEYSAFLEALPEEFHPRIVSGEALAVGWLERRIPEEMLVYPTLCRIAHGILAEGLSEKVIVPGLTTTADVAWWYRERIQQLSLSTWFHPSVSVQRRGQGHTGTFVSRPEAEVILPGDLIHVDLGITYLGLNTDTQQHAYVLRPGETDAPPGLKQALARGNRLQDILTAQFQKGRTGNEILAAALAQARAEGIRASIYTHPIGFHGHGAGPTIGLWDQQEGVPGNGDYPLYPHTAHSIELNVTEAIPEWEDQETKIMLEEDAYFDGREVRYLDGRQTELFLIPRPAPHRP